MPIMSFSVLETGSMGNKLITKYSCVSNELQVSSFVAS
jgi:hypothetical protein